MVAFLVLSDTSISRPIYMYMYCVKVGWDPSILTVSVENNSRR